MILIFSVSPNKNDWNVELVIGSTLLVHNLSVFMFLKVLNGGIIHNTIEIAGYVYSYCCL